MSIKGNLIYSTLLTLSTYLVPLVVFPYISRVLGAENIGAIDTIDNIIDYCILFSMMGMSSVGIREVAKNKDNAERLQATFNNLFWLNAISTGIVFCLLALATLLLPDMQSRLRLLGIGSIKLIANLFWIEWLYRGLENFRFITIRSIIVRLLFIMSVFLLVKHKGDFETYYTLFVGVVVLNAVCNWTYKRNWVSLRFKVIDLKQYVKPFVVLGLFAMLSAIYTKLSMPVLNFTCGDEQAGYYAVSTRMYQVIIALISSLVSVIIPRMSVLLKEGKTEEIYKLTDLAFRLLFFLALPVIIFMEIFAPDIIHLFAGAGYEAAILPMRIVMLQVLVIGTEQIYVLQLLIPMKRDRAVVLCGACGVSVWLILSIILIPTLQSVGSALTWVAAESTVLLFAAREVKRQINIRFPWQTLVHSFAVSLPYVILGIGVVYLTNNTLVRIFAAAMAFSIYAFLLWRKEQWKK